MRTTVVSWDRVWRHAVGARSAVWCGLLGACVALSWACASCTTTPSTRPAGSAGETPAFDAVSALKSVAGELPETTHTVLVVDAQRFLVAPFRGAYDAMGGEQRFGEEALFAFAHVHLGVDVARARHVVVVVSDDALLALVDRQAPAVAASGSVVARGDAPQAQPVFDLALEALALTPLEADGWVAVGLPVYVERWLAARQARPEARFTATPSAGALTSALASVSETGALVVAASALEPWRLLPHGLLPQAWGLVPWGEGYLPGSEDPLAERWSSVVGVALTPTDLTLTVRASAEMASVFEARMTELRQHAERLAAHRRASPSQPPGDLPDAYVAALPDRMIPRRDGDRLRMSVPLAHAPSRALPAASPPELGAALARFRDLSARAITQEATHHLNALADALAALPEAHAYAASGELEGFPRSTRSAPGQVVSCCAAHGGPDQDRDGFCDADPERWADDATFQALDFAPPDRTRFVYVVDNQLASNMAIEVRAYADVDCDGIASEWVARVEYRYDRYGEVEVSVHPAAPVRARDALE